MPVGVAPQLRFESGGVTVIGVTALSGAGVGAANGVWSDGDVKIGTNPREIAVDFPITLPFASIQLSKLFACVCDSPILLQVLPIFAGAASALGRKAPTKRQAKAIDDSGFFTAELLHVTF